MAALRHGLLIVCLALSSCQALFQPPLTIVDSSPSAGRYTSGALSVWVEFSAPVPHGKAEKGIVLKENGATMEVRYAWTGHRVVVTPVAGLSMGNRYDLTVSSTVEDGNGLDLGTEYIRTFYTRPNDTRPTATMTPPLGAIVTDRLQPLAFQFSQAIDRASFYNNLTMTPSFKSAYTWGAGDLSCVVTPLEQLKTPVIYTIKLSSALVDTEGNSLGTDLTSWFSEGTVAAGPVVASVVRTVSGTADSAFTLTPASASGSVTADTGFERTWGLEIRFDRPVTRDGLDSFITAEPAWGYSIPSTQVSVQNVDLVPTTPLVYGTTYTLTVRKGVPDLGGNLSTADQVYRFKVDGPASAPPHLERLTFLTNVIEGDHSTDFMALDLGLFNGSATYFVLTFELAQGAYIDTSSLMTHLSVSASDPNSSVALTAVGTPVSIDSSHQSVRVDCLFTRGGSGLVIFKLSAGVADSLGNVTGADEAWPVLE